MIHKMYVALGALLFGAMTVQAQSSVVAGGCDAKNAENVTMGISIGQLAVETFKNGNSLLLGIQQDFSVPILDIDGSTAIHEETYSQPTVSVIGRTIYISNINGEPCAVYDIAGKCAYACKDMMNAMITVRVVGVYVVKIGDKQQNVVIK